MKNVKCFDVVNMVIEEANKRFAPIHTLNIDSVEILQHYCDMIDSLATEFDGYFYEVDVDEIKMTVKIILGCHFISITSIYHPVMKLALKCKFFRIHNTTGGLPQIEFVFPSLWKLTKKDAN